MEHCKGLKYQTRRKALASDKHYEYFARTSTTKKALFQRRHLVTLVHVSGAAFSAAAPEAVALAVSDGEGADLAGDGRVHKLVQKR